MAEGRNLVKRRWMAVTVIGQLALMCAVVAAADSPCGFKANILEAGENGTSLVARLENPPRTRVVLTIDGPGGLNQELVWDPAVGDGLQHDALLPTGKYSILAFADDDRIQTSQLLMVTSTRFFTIEQAITTAKKLPFTSRGKSNQVAIMGSRVRTLIATGQQTASYLTQPAEEDPSRSAPEPSSKKAGKDKVSKPGETGEFIYNDNNPRLILTCDDGRVELSRLRLNTKQLQAGSVARGFLDSAAPTVVTDTLSLIAEIAVERAKTGAMEIVRDRFFNPICSELHLHRLQLGSSEEIAFPRVCALLRSSRIEDLLSSGRSLLEAARDDVRLTLMPRLIAKADIPPVAREVAQLALRLGNEMLGGGATDSAAIDLVVTQMDRILRVGAATSFEAVKAQFIDEAMGLKQREQREELVKAVLLRFLPTDPGELISDHPAAKADPKLAEMLLMKDVEPCKRPKDEAHVIPADRTGCIGALADKLANTVDLQDRVSKIVNEDELIGLIDAVRKRSGASTFEEWLATNINLTERSIKAMLDKPPPALLRTCALRATIGIVKWCSARDSCSAADIATAMAKPENLFAPPDGIVPDMSNSGNPATPPGDSDLEERLCWVKANGKASETHRLRLPAVRTPYVELAARALAFLTPPAKGEEQQRAVAVLRWIFDIAKVAVSQTGDTPSPIQKLEEIVGLFAQRDYVRAISQTVLMAAEARGCTASKCEIPKELEKATTLLAAVGSYLQVYDDTKNSDPAEAKAARKKALESLIDSSTDRKHRAGDRIVSLGVPVGFTGSLRWTPGAAGTGATGRGFRDLYQLEDAFAWRLPLSLAVQWLPEEGRSRGWHLGLTFADLGNFARGDANGEDDKIQWKDFLQLGVQGAVTLGNRRHTVLLGLDLSWNPGLYEREIMVTNADGTMESVQQSGAYMMGLTLAYYVPLFDLN